MFDGCFLLAPLARGRLPRWREDKMLSPLIAQGAVLAAVAAAVVAAA